MRITVRQPARVSITIGNRGSGTTVTEIDGGLYNTTVFESIILDGGGS